MEEADKRRPGTARGLTLYVREGCHLCDEMASELARHAAGAAIKVSLVDIDADPRLQAAYDHKVPVLTLGDYEICHYFLDHGALDAALADQAPSK